MKTVALEDLVASTILTFCENAAELGCPMHKEVDMWFRGLTPQQMSEVGDRLLSIQEQYYGTDDNVDLCSEGFDEEQGQTKGGLEMENVNMVKKTIELENGDLAIEFTDSELKQLGLEKGDKFDVEARADGSIVLKKYAKIDIDLGTFERPILEFLIQESCEKDVSINVIVSDILKQIIESN